MTASSIKQPQFSAAAAVIKLFVQTCSCESQYMTHCADCNRTAHAIVISTIVATRRHEIPRIGKGSQRFSWIRDCLDAQCILRCSYTLGVCSNQILSKQSRIHWQANPKNADTVVRQALSKHCALRALDGSHSSTEHRQCILALCKMMLAVEYLYVGSHGQGYRRP